MAILMYMSTEYSIADARNNLPRLVHETEQGETIRITRRGKPVAVLLSLDAFEELVAERPDLWESLVAFRARHDLSDPPGNPFADTRDPSPGRSPGF